MEADRFCHWCGFEIPEGAEIVTDEAEGTTVHAACHERYADSAQDEVDEVDPDVLYDIHCDQLLGV